MLDVLSNRVFARKILLQGRCDSNVTGVTVGGVWLVLGGCTTLCLARNVLKLTWTVKRLFTKDRYTAEKGCRSLSGTMGQVLENPEQGRVGEL